MHASDRAAWRGHFFGEAAAFLRAYEAQVEISTASIDALPDRATIWAIRDEVVEFLEARAKNAPAAFWAAMAGVDP